MKNENDKEQNRPKTVDEKKKEPLCQRKGAFFCGLLKVLLSVFITFSIFFFTAPLWKKKVFSEIYDLQITSKTTIKNSQLLAEKDKEIKVLQDELNEFKDEFLVLQNRLNTKLELLENVSTNKNEPETIKSDKDLSIKLEKNKGDSADENKEVQTTPLTNKENDDIKDIYDSLVTALEKKDEINPILVKLKEIKLSDAFKNLLNEIQLVLNNLKSQDEVVKLFEKVYLNLHKEKGLEVKKGLSQKVLLYLKQHVKIEIDGKEVLLSSSDIVDRAKTFVDKHNFLKAIDVLKNLNEIVDVKDWLVVAQNFVKFESLVQKIKQFKGPFIS